MKQLIKSFFVKAKIYEYIKYSSIFHIYTTFFKPQEKKTYQREIAFYKSFLPECQLIFDIGANDGHKTEAFLKISEKVVCCEPDPQNFKTLKIRFRNKKGRVSLINKAVAASTGKKDMYLHHPGSAFNTLNEKFKQTTEADDLVKWNEKIKYDQVISVESITLDELINKYGKPDFIKIDVEGYEMEVIKGLSVPVNYVSLECLLPDFETELNEILTLLNKLHSQLVFNIAINEKLLLKEFMNEDLLYDYLKTFNQNHFELIVHMQQH